MERHPLPAKAARRLAELAPDVVRHVDDAVAQGRPADVTLAAYFREHRELGARDRRFLSDLLFSHYRWKGWTGGPDQAGLAASCLLDAANLHPAAELLAQRAALPGGPRPLGAATLDEKAAASAAWLGRPLGIESLVPDWFPSVLAQPSVAGGADPGSPRSPCFAKATQGRPTAATAHLARCIASFQQRPPTWLRLKRGAEQNVLDDLARAEVRIISQVGPAVAVDGSSALNALRGLARSRFEVQDLASQCVGRVCSPAPGQRWWDVCAGAGGKTLHLADLMEDRGHVLATDVRPEALAELRRRARRAGVSCIKVERRGSGRGGFDGVLVDAPCSNIGTWSRNPDARWRTSETDVQQRADVQSKLLRDAADAVRPGGALVYSVCTVTSAETVGIIEPFLRGRPDFTLEPTVHPLHREPASGMIWIWPWQGPCDSMFIARMKKDAG
ncbi:MAG: RsmB/NOP family class I SAM-dependent RNA methyltransferase [Verrucomicrobiota bacterium]